MTCVLPYQPEPAHGSWCSCNRCIAREMSAADLGLKNADLIDLIDRKMNEHAKRAALSVLGDA